MKIHHQDAERKIGYQRTPYCGQHTKGRLTTTSNSRRGTRGTDLRLAIERLVELTSGT